MQFVHSIQDYVTDIAAAQQAASFELAAVDTDRTSSAVHWYSARFQGAPPSQVHPLFSPHPSPCVSCCMLRAACSGLGHSPRTALLPSAAAASGPTGRGVPRRMRAVHHVQRRPRHAYGKDGAMHGRGFWPAWWRYPACHGTRGVGLTRSFLAPPGRMASGLRSGVRLAQRAARGRSTHSTRGTHSARGMSSAPAVQVQYEVVNSTMFCGPNLEVAQRAQLSAQSATPEFIATSGTSIGGDTGDSGTSIGLVIAIIGGGAALSLNYLHLHLHLHLLAPDSPLRPSRISSCVPHLQPSCSSCPFSCCAGACCTFVHCMLPVAARAVPEHVLCAVCGQ